MLDPLFKDPAAIVRLRSCVLGPHLDSFAVRLREDGYAPATMRWQLWVAADLARWMVRGAIAVTALDETVVESFTEDRRRRGRLHGGNRFALHLLLVHLRAEGVVPPRVISPDESPRAILCRRYGDCLVRERSLHRLTIAGYIEFACDFLAERFPDGAVRTESLTAQDVTDFLLPRFRTFAPRRGQYLCTALRSFFRFLFSRGETETDLSKAVLTVPVRGLVAVPRYLSSADVERVLAACDLGTPTGRRDHAILLLLARLGLRAGEVVALCLDDLDWRRGEFVVRGKGHQFDRLPLLPEVGDALAKYLSHDRPTCPSRRVFIRMKARRRGFASPAAVTTLVERAIARAGLDPPWRGAHVLRHSLATRMIRSGATMAQIGEVLRHRSANTTEIYAKVDFEALRALALPWPRQGGRR
jgi:site-specific recombinase XerD